MSEKWNKSSWRKFPISQQPEYKDLEYLKEITDKISTLPSLIYPKEALDLQNDLAKVAKGEAFLLQGGDCAESFAEFNEKNLVDFFKLTLQMTVALMYGTGKQVVKVGRVAGQFAKPRSSEYEEKDGKKLPSYRGDMVNNINFTEEARQANPENMLKVYYQSCATLNFLRSLSKGGFSTLDKISGWNQDFINYSKDFQKYNDIVNQIDKLGAFIKGCGASINDIKIFNQADFYISHEALILDYEEAFTRYDEALDGHYSTSAHMLWIGDRTRILNGAHVEYIRGINNPIGIKIGSNSDKDEVVKLLDLINPNNIPGRIVLIVRMGAKNVLNLLPSIIKAVEKSGHIVVWSCDPMHGNTITLSNGFKTRNFDSILEEIKSFFVVHKACGTYAGGVHFEMTGQNVTECIGGTEGINDQELSNRYHTHCDPRLNNMQSLELSLLLAEELVK